MTHKAAAMTITGRKLSGHSVDLSLQSNGCCFLFSDVILEVSRLSFYARSTFVVILASSPTNETAGVHFCTGANVSDLVMARM